MTRDDADNWPMGGRFTAGRTVGFTAGLTAGLVGFTAGLTAGLVGFTAGLTAGLNAGGYCAWLLFKQ